MNYTGILQRCLFLGWAMTNTAQGDQAFFQPADRRIVFLGDSITEQLGYTTLVETFLLTRYPERDMIVRNIGWAGDTAYFDMRGGYTNGLARDVRPLQPDAMTIKFGMNDAGEGPDGLPDFRAHLERLVSDLHSSCRLALISPNAAEGYLPGVPGGQTRNLSLKQYTEVMRDVAEEHGLRSVNLYEPFLRTMGIGRASGVLGQEGEPRLTYDEIHPNWAGHLIMAVEILRGLALPPIDVAIELQLDTPVEVKPPTLPWQLPADTHPALAIPGFDPVSEFSRYRVRCEGLSAGSYRLSIDGEDAGLYSAAALGEGINLTLSDSPPARRAEKLFDLVMKKNKLFFLRWRAVEHGSPTAYLAPPRHLGEPHELDDEVAELDREIDRVRKPVAYTFTVRREEG